MRYERYEIIDIFLGVKNIKPLEQSESKHSFFCPLSLQHIIQFPKIVSFLDFRTKNTALVMDFRTKHTTSILVFPATNLKPV